MYYKSLLINSCTQYASPESNCEDTHVENLIDFLIVSSNYFPNCNNDIIIPEENSTKFIGCG